MLARVGVVSMGAESTQVTTVKRLFVLGDSISIHYGPYLKRMVQGIFHYARKSTVGELAPDHCCPVDANGGDSSMVLTYLRERLGADAPDLLLLNCGLHDLRTDPTSGVKQVGPDDYRRNLAEIADLVRDRDVHTAWVRTTPVDDDTHNTRSVGFHRFNRDVVSYNGIADSVFGEAGFPIVDLYAFTHCLGADLFCDHVHFVERVRELQAAVIAGYLLAAHGH